MKGVLYVEDRLQLAKVCDGVRQRMERRGEDSSFNPFNREPIASRMEDVWPIDYLSLDGVLDYLVFRCSVGVVFVIGLVDHHVEIVDLATAVIPELCEENAIGGGHLYFSRNPSKVTLTGASEAFGAVSAEHADAVREVVNRFFGYRDFVVDFGARFR